MKQSFTPIAIFLIGILLLTACSRPTAYFQPSPREFATNTSATPTELPVTPPAAEQSQMPSLVQTMTALDQMEVLVSRDGKLAHNKSVQQRLSRMRTALAQVSAKAKSVKSAAPRKLTLLEQVMVKKLNKKISKQLSPNQPQKAMASKDILVAGAVLVLGGLALVLLTSGAGAVIGLVALAVGLVMLLIGIL